MQHTAVNLVTTFWPPSNRLNFIEESRPSFRSVLLHCRRRSYLTGTTFLQLCRVIHSSLNKADDCGYGGMARKK